MQSTGRKLTLLSLVVLLFSGMVWAQRGSQILEVEVPFEFEVANQSLPAGTYIIEREGSYTLVFHDARRQVVAIAVALPAEMVAPPNDANVQFYLEGGRHVLARVWSANSRYGYELIPAKPAPTLARSRTGASSGR